LSKSEISQEGWGVVGKTYMFDVLILGYSSIVKRRVLPALISLAQVEKIHVASQKGFSGEIIPPGKKGKVFLDYETALADCPPCLCYVSLPNSMHAEWAYRALEKGFHVIIDKPAVTKRSDAVELAELANRQGLCISEANVWTYHPLMQTVSKIVRVDDNAPLAAIAVFTSPPLDPGNFRYNPLYGAGVILDRCPYVVSCGRVLYNDVPAKISCDIVSVAEEGEIDISCSVTMIYPNRSTLMGFFSLGTEYRNTLSIIGKSLSCDVDRIFTPPADFEGSVVVSRKNIREVMSVPKYDAFAGYLKDIINCIDNNSFSHFGRIFLDDSCVLGDLRIAANANLTGVS